MPLASFDGLTVTSLPHLIERFDPITLTEMDAVVLQDRVDTKYLFGRHRLTGVLEDLRQEYRLLEVDGVRGTHYRSLYLDTPGLRDYFDHHNERTFRSKTRFREYLGSGLVYLEVKRKTGQGRTDKVRMRTDGIPEALDGTQRAFISKATGKTDELIPTLWNRFVRFTLVHRHRLERLTIDVDLRFAHPAAAEQWHPMEGIVVAELKQSRADSASPFAMHMRALGVRQAGMSKYCVGLLQVRPEIKYNRFKEVLRMIARMRQAA